MVLEEAEPCIRMRMGPLYQSPWLALSFWPTLEVHIHAYAQTYTWANRRRAQEHCFIFFSKMSNVIFVTHTAISEAVLDEAFAQLNIEVFTDINMSKRLLKEIARERHHTIETTEYVYFWKAKKALCLWLFAAKYSVQLCKGIGSWRHWTMLISSDLMHG